MLLVDLNLPRYLCGLLLNWKWGDILVLKLKWSNKLGCFKNQTNITCSTLLNNLVYLDNKCTKVNSEPILMPYWSILVRCLN